MNLPTRTRKSAAGRPFSDEERNRQVVDLFRSGLTTPQIAQRFGVGQSWIAQLLRIYGVSRFEGGKSEIARQRRSAEAAAASARKAATREPDVAPPGFDTLEQYMAARSRFKEQAKRARERRIGWSLTFEQWWAIWCASGVWEKRGRSAGDSAVMARRGDDGPYSVENVYITTLAKNFVDSHLFRGHQVKEQASEAAVFHRASASLSTPLNKVAGRA